VIIYIINPYPYFLKGRGFNESKGLALKIKIHYHHTDCGGVVYYANYLNFLEEARTAYFEQLGYSMKKLMEQGTWFVVARQEIDYKSPARYADTLEIDARVSKVTGVRLEFEYEIRSQDNVLIVKAKTVLVCVDKELKPKPIPQDIFCKLKPKDTNA